MKTRFDRWLIKTFVYKTSIYSMQLPKKLPRRCRVKKLEPKPGGRFKFILTMPSTRGSEKLMDLLREEGLTFKSNIHESKGLLAKMINPKKKSFTWRVFWCLVIFSSIYFFYTEGKKIIESEEFQTLWHSYFPAGSPF